MDRGSASDESKVIPIELMGRTPRSVRMTGTGWVNVFAATLFILVGVVFSAKIAKEVVDATETQNALRHGAGESSGLITGKWIKGRTDSRISYSFSVDGTNYAGNSAVPRSIWRNLREAGSLTIRYLPASPNINHPAAWEDSTTPSLLALIFTVFLMFFGFLFVRRLPLQRRLAMEGIAVPGCITEREMNRSSKGQPHVDYSFRNANGDLECGSCPSDYRLKAGTSVCVLYMLSDPRRSEIYPSGVDFFRIDQ